MKINLVIQKSCSTSLLSKWSKGEQNVDHMMNKFSCVIGSKIYVHFMKELQILGIVWRNPMWSVSGFWSILLYQFDVY